MAVGSMAKADALVFANEEALLVALTSMVPSDVQGAPVRFAKDDAGEVTLVPQAPLPADLREALGGAGVRIQQVDPPPWQACCWAEVLRTDRLPESAVTMQLVLFLLDGDESLVKLAGELLRLGCDRQAYAIQRRDAGRVALLRAADPPYYTVASALDRGAGFSAFVPLRPGQEMVFAELGYSHPLKETIHAAPGEIVLIPKEGPWVTLPNGPWTDVYQLIDFRLPETPKKKAPIEPPRRLTVPLRFSKATRTEPAALWVIREDAVAAGDRLVQTLPDDVIARLLFAVTEQDGEPVVVLKARMGRSGPPEIDVPGEAYVSLLRIANLFVPRDRIVEPPLRRDKLRELLAPSDEEVGWLAPLGEDGERFRVESLPDGAFRPLMDWVDYLVEAGASALSPWVESTLFDFEPYVSVGVEWADQPPPERKEAQERGRPKQRREVDDREDADELDFEDDTDPGGPDASALPPRREELIEPVEGDLLTPDEQQLSELEQQFLELDLPLDAPERSTIWAEMARINGRLNRQRDAGLCWTYALWEDQGESAAQLAREWLEVDAGSSDPNEIPLMLEKSLSAAKPSRSDVRNVVAIVVSAHLAGSPEPSALGDIHRIQVWLDEQDDILDVRSLWLARHALADLVGGDSLAMARARDRILARLRMGLSLERDVPNFLRFLGGRPSGGRASDQLADRLEALFTTYGKTSRRRKPIEAKEELTGAYVRLVFAYGFARLGRSERARELREEARQALPIEDPIHSFLLDAFSARIDHALEGRPAETPLPSEIAGRLNGLGKFERYLVDRLREVSTILEPQEHLEPIRAYQRAEKDPRGPEFERLRGMSDTDELGREIDRLMDAAVRADPQERDRLFDGLMDFFPIIPSRAKRNLDLVVDNLEPVESGRRALLLQEALMLAGYFGLSQMVRDLASRLQSLLGQLDGKQAVVVAGEFGKSLRSLRRVGLKEEAADLLEQMEGAISGEGSPEMVARVQVAGGLIYLGDLERARPFMQSAHQFLDARFPVVPRGNQPAEPCLQVHSALASAWSQAPEQHAVAGLDKLAKHLRNVTDSYGTNTHFCRSVIQFMESLVLGYASEHLALGELGRRWLDEDEYLIRRRIHRTLGA